MNRRLVAVIWPFCVVVLILLFLGLVSMKVLSGVRAYVSGESVWSRVQKQSVDYLEEYAKSHDIADYRRFLVAVDVILGDKQARVQLQSPNPDLNLAAQGFLRGKNLPEDVPGMITLFRLFQHTSLLKPSIEYWTQGDALVEKIIVLATQMHLHIASGKPDPDKIQTWIDDINKVNFALTPLEAAFSDSIGVASQKVQVLVAEFMLGMTLFLMTVGIMLSYRLVLREALYIDALRVSEERWKFALDAARDVVWEWHVLTKKIHYSGQWKTILGYENGESSTTTTEWEKMVHPDDLLTVQTASRAYVAGETDHYAIEHRLRCHDGSYKWVLTRGKIVAYSKDDKAERLVGTHTDIDQIKRIESALRESDANQRALLEAMIDGVFVAQDYHFVFANPILPEMLGYSYDEFIGLPFESVIAPDFLHDWSERFAASVGGALEADKHYQVRLLMKDGQHSIWFDLRTSRVDYQGKPSVLGILRDISKQKEAEEIIWHQANFDMLTGLPNRRMFRDRLEQEIKKTERAESVFALMFLDLDHFKGVNDALGHDQGDALLKQAAERLQTCVRETDTVARLGGDEFVILLRQMDDSTGLDKVAKNILTSLAKPFQLGAEPVYISASIGITLYPIDATAFDDLLKNADQAMYAAKDEGRNRYTYFTTSMQTAAKDRMRIANDLRHACERGEFKLAYQPIVEIASGQIRKAEALIRWHHPTLGLVNPAQFIAIAEDTGIIHEIGDWVFQQAAQQAAKWRKTLHPDFQVSINKSPIQFRGKDSGWIQQLADMNIAGRSLAIEITEGLLLDASGSVIERLQAFRKAGVQVAIDDFGTGYSSLSYLKKFDIDYIKIDQSFVRNISAGSNDMGLCEAIIVMAHKLGMKVIAEGVETKAQLMLLEEAGCDYAQGYLFSKPVSDTAFEQFVQAVISGSDQLNA